MDLVQIVFNSSDRVINNRTIQDILTHATTEMGELAEEIQIENGRSYKDPGKDGVVGEAIDVIACMIDLIKIHTPNITLDELNTLMYNKCIKWETKYNTID